MVRLRSAVRIRVSAPLSRKNMKKVFFNYTFGLILIVGSVATFTQSLNPTFLASADAADVPILTSSVILSVVGGILFISGFLIIVFKVIKGKH